LNVGIDAKLAHTPRNKVRILTTGIENRYLRCKSLVQRRAGTPLAKSGIEI
jgi:hypothetical protein